MIRLFISLLLVLLLVVIGYLLGIGGTVQYFTKDISEDISLGQVGGVAKLLDQQIAGMTEEQRKLELKEIQSLFIYEVDLLPISQIPNDQLTTEDKARLKTKGVAVIEKEGGEINYFKSSIDQHAWKIEVLPTMQNQEADFIKGPIKLIDQKLSNANNEELKLAIEDIDAAFASPVRLVTMANAKRDELLNKQQSERLESGKSVLIYEDQFYLSYIFHRFTNSNNVLKIGPFKYPYLFTNITWIAFTFLGLLIATAIWLWLRPLWRDLRNLNSASRIFGEGQLDTRVKLPRYSLIQGSLSSFNNMADHIEQLISSHKMLTNAVSHELRTPVARLRFGLEMLENADNESKKARYIQSMNTDIEELDEMLAELLSYARMNRHGIKLKKTPINLKDWLNQQSLPLECDKHVNIKITKSSKGLTDDPVSCMDHKLIERALQNLIQNACRYAKETISIHLFHDNGKYLLSVEDDGEGIPEEHHSTVFNPFTRVDTSRDRDSGGYGLGLAIVKQIMDAHNGQVRLQDSALGGAKFCLEWQCKT